MVNKLDDTPAPGEKIEICLDVQYNTSYGQVLVQCSNLTTSYAYQVGDLILKSQTLYIIKMRKIS